MKKGKWSKEEDELMKKHIEKYGIGRSWQALSNTIGIQRCGRSCRSRWLNYLRPGLKHSNFTPAEERIICEMYRQMGSCWSIIAAQFPGRTDLAIKNYWNSTLKKRFSAARSLTVCRRHHPSASTMSDARKRDELQLVIYGEESNTTGSSGHAGILDLDTPAMATSQPQLVQPPLTVAGEIVKGESIKQQLTLCRAPLEDTPLQPVAMDIILTPVSPISLAFMEPDLPWIAGFDEIDGFLQCFD